MSQTLADDSEVVFDQPEERAGAMEPEGSLQNRHRKETWLEATEPYRGARPRTMEFDRPVDGGLGATLGDVEDEDKSPVAALEDTVSRMQRDLEELQTENRFLRTPRASRPVPLVRQAALTTTKVPWFNGSTSWGPYLQVFDAIVLSNGWGDATAALQLLSHLQRGIINTDAPPGLQEGIDRRPVLWETGEGSFQFRYYLGDVGC